MRIVAVGDYVVEGRKELKSMNAEALKSLAWQSHRPRRRAVRPHLWPLEILEVLKSATSKHPAERAKPANVFAERCR